MIPGSNLHGLCAQELNNRWNTLSSDCKKEVLRTIAKPSGDRNRHGESNFPDANPPRYLQTLMPTLLRDEFQTLLDYLAGEKELSGMLLAPVLFRPENL
jgi:hypothetical protein